MRLEFFRNFPSLEDVKTIANVLDKHGITYEINENTRKHDLTFLGSSLSTSGIEMKFSLKASPDDFKQIHDLIDKEIEVRLDEVEKDHYLFDFSTDELTEVLMKPNEWSVFDFKVAGLILNDRGITISKEFLDSMKKQGHSELLQKESYSSIWIVVGYISAFLGGILGFGIGISLWFMTKRLPSGEKIYTFTDVQRKHGKRITIIGFAVLLLTIAFRVYWFSHVTYIY